MKESAIDIGVVFEKYGLEELPALQVWKTDCGKIVVLDEKGTGECTVYEWE